jgi:RNA polymerase sigma-70 factor, ECF subfamily
MVFLMTERADAEMITALCRGDTAGLEILYDRYNKLVYTIAFRILAEPEAAADLTQEVFLSLWQKPDRYDASRGDLAVFLAVVTRSQALNRLRQSKSQQNLVQRISGGSLPSHFEAPGLAHLSLEELRHRMGQALQQLPDNQRQVLEMAYYDDLSQSEITAKTGIPLGTVKSRSRQGLLKLQTLLKDWGA